jgi:hypothetical protein
MVNTVAFVIFDSFQRQATTNNHTDSSIYFHNGDATRDHCLVQKAQMSICKTWSQGKRTLYNDVKLWVHFHHLLRFPHRCRSHRASAMQAPLEYHPGLYFFVLFPVLCAYVAEARALLYLWELHENS